MKFSVSLLSVQILVAADPGIQKFYNTEAKKNCFLNID